MKISSDIISDVAAAADPARAELARRRLEALAGDVDGGFARLVEPGASAAQSRPSIGAVKLESPRHQSVARAVSGAGSVEAAYRALGGVLLQKTFETMLPAQGGAGKSTAASMWKSMLAQRLADSVAASIFPAPGASAGTDMPTSADFVATPAPQARLQS